MTFPPPPPPGPDLTNDGAPDDDVIQTFQLEESGLRGRAIRLGPALDDILAAHDYPEPVARLVAEAVTLAAALSSMLKYEGIFTLQAKGDGPVGMIVADITSEGIIRGCASYDAARLMGAAEGLAALMGKGYLVFTVDPQGPGAQRYQGIVEMSGETLADCARHYFAQSEQVQTGIMMAAGRPGTGWRGGAVMLQRMPEEGGKAPGEAQEDDWRRAMTLLNTCTDEELLSPYLHSNALLFRLFHEEGVRVYKPKDMRKGCRCGAAKLENLLSGMSANDLDYMAKDGVIEATCEFCGAVYKFDRAAIKSKIDAGSEERFS